MGLDDTAPYKVTVNCDWWAAERWCDEHIGVCGIHWYRPNIDIAVAASGDHRTTWYFKDEAALSLFLLRWS